MYKNHLSMEKGSQNSALVKNPDNPHGSAQNEQPAVARRGLLIQDNEALQDLKTGSDAKMQTSEAAKTSLFQRRPELEERKYEANSSLPPPYNPIGPLDHYMSQNAIMITPTHKERPRNKFDSPYTALMASEEKFRDFTSFLPQQ
jgi:hypothetical protein